jgi:hypothetical protein
MFREVNGLRVEDVSNQLVGDKVLKIGWRQVV